MQQNKGDEKVAIIPVREGSQRVNDKNFREFWQGQSLLDLKIQQLKDENCFDRIFVSSDSKLAQQIAERHGVEFLMRDPALCSNDVRWAQVISGAIETIPGNNPVVAWVHVTSPLHTEYSAPMETFFQLEESFDSLVSVARVREFLLSEKGRPVNYHWGVWHDYSQDLEPLYRVTGALFIARKKSILHWHYLIGTRPKLYEVDDTAAVDVDTRHDFELAQHLFHQRMLSCEPQTV